MKALNLLILLKRQFYTYFKQIIHFSFSSNGHLFKEYPNKENEVIYLKNVCLDL